MGANFNMNLLRNGRLGRHMRLKDYDYSRPGGYFVTTVTRGRKNLFGRIVNGVMGLNELGCIVVDEWLHMVDMREGMELDEFIVLPNHFHAIVIFYEQNKPGNQSVASTQRVAPDNYQARATRWVDATEGEHLRIIRLSTKIAPRR